MPRNWKNKFSIFPHFEDVFVELSRDEQKELSLAILEFGAAGIEPEFDSKDLRIAFAGVRDAITNSVQQSNKNKGGRPKNTKKKTQEIDEENLAHEEEKQAFQNSKTGVFDCENPNLSSPNLSYPILSSPENSFAFQCLNAFNEIKGTTYITMPPECTRTLNRFDGTYSVEQVKAMVSYKVKEWAGTKYKNSLTPNTLFSPQHFEQYMHQSLDDAKEAADYAKYDL